MIFLIIMMGTYFSLFLTLPVIIFFHELGHALAYLILTKSSNVDIYIGSYGNKQSKINFRISKLRFFLNTSFPFIPFKGLCHSNKMETNYVYRIIILLAGPVFSLLIAFTFGWIALYFDLHGAFKLFCFVLMIFSTISLITNLNPKSITDSLDSDGRQLMFTIRIRKVYHIYISGVEYFNNANYPLAIEAFLTLIEQIKKEKKILKLLIRCFKVTEQYNLALKYSLQLQDVAHFETEDYYNLALLQTICDDNESAIKNYEIVLKRDQKNVVVLFNLGYQAIIKAEYDKAIVLLNRAIKVDPEYSHAYNFLGLANILSDNLEAGNLLISKSLQINPSDAFAYKHLGLYYLKMHNKEMAISSFKKAVEFDANIDLENYLNEALAIA